MERLSNFIFDKSKLIIAFVALMNLAALVSLTRFAIDSDVTGFFGEDNDVYNEYLALTEKYDISESVAILIEDNDSLLTEENMLTVYGLRESAEQVSGVSEVQSFLPEELPIGSRSLDIDDRFIGFHYDEVEDYTRHQYAPADQLLSDDESTGIIALTLDHDADGDAVVDELKPLLDSHENVKLSLAGDPVIGDTLEWYLLRIFLFLPPAAGSLVLLTFYSMLRNRRLTILSMVPAGLGALWTVGTIFLQGDAVNIVTAVSPVFIIVMGSADGLHYTTHLLEKLNLYKDRRTLTLETMRMVFKPIVLTSLTTMAGFGSLAWSDLEPIRQMGLYIPIGIGYACFLSVVFLPALLTRISLPSEGIQQKDGIIEFFVNLRHHRRAILIAVAVVLVIAGLNLPGLKVISDPLLFFKPGSDIRQTFNTVEDEFGGALVIIGDIEANGGLKTLRDADYAEEILDMERDLERMPGILTATSLFDVVQGSYAGATGQPDYPESPSAVNLILERMDDEDLEAWYAEGGLRLIARTNDLSIEDAALLRDFVDEHPALRTLNGTPILYDELSRLTVKSQVQSLGLALILVFVMLFVVFKSFRAAVIGLLPIVIAVVGIMGCLSITGYHLNLVTATMSAVAVGVGVDYAIHLISGIQYFRGHGMELDDAVTEAMRTVSRPILASAFGLSIGMSVMFLSPLYIHMQVATIMWVAMMISSFGALALIPLFYRNGQKPRTANTP
ncbi:RND family transporter [Chloroflexota bacterium]